MQNQGSAGEVTFTPALSREEQAEPVPAIPLLPGAWEWAHEVGGRKTLVELD